MSGTIRVLRKELFALFESWRGFALVLVLPALLLLLVGQLRTQSPQFRLLVAGAAQPRDADANHRAQLLREIAALEITWHPEAVRDPFRALRDGRYDLLLDLACTGDPGCDSEEVIYTLETDPGRLATMDRIARAIGEALRAGGEGPPASTSDLMKQLAAIGAFPASALRPYYPQAVEGSLFLLPMVISLTLCFLPFALTTAAVIREIEGRTLEVLLAAPGIGPVEVFSGKFLMAVVVTLLQFALMLVLSQTIYGLHVKPGLVEIGVDVVLSVAISALLGLAVSSSARAQSHALLAAALYFLALIMLCGFVFPLDQSSRLIRALSSLLPRTFLQPALRAWMFGAAPLRTVSEVELWLAGQAVAYGALAIAAYRSALRRV